MSKVTEALATLGIHNPHNFSEAGGAKVFVTYSTPGMGFYRVARYIVVGMGFETNPNAHWKDNGCKTFVVIRRSNKNRKRDEALKWAAQTFHIKEWAKMPYRESWVEKLAYDKVMKMLKSNRGDANGRNTVGED